VDERIPEGVVVIGCVRRARRQVRERKDEGEDGKKKKNNDNDVI
jgi:hypothetical protein